MPICGRAVIETFHTLRLEASCGREAIGRLVTIGFLRQGQERADELLQSGSQGWRPIGGENRFMKWAFDEAIEPQALGRRQGLADFKSRILNHFAYLVLSIAHDFLNCVVLPGRELQILIQFSQECLAQDFGWT
jgi:hypothetical protein